jgi:hypothetical protein
MKTAKKWGFGSIMGKLVIGFVLALMIGGINVVPAFSEEYTGNDNVRYERRERGQTRYERDRHRNARYEQERRMHQRERYERRRRNYEPPPVIFVPPPPPGIRIFFPPIIIHP